MQSKTLQNTVSSNHRRIGRKVLQADRISRALEGPVKSQNSSFWKRFSFAPKTIALTCVVVLVTSTVVIGGSQYFLGRAAEAKKVELAEQQKVLKEKSDAANACRLKKATEKSDLIGKVTYDELYDNNSCDK